MKDDAYIKAQKLLDQMTATGLRHHLRNTLAAAIKRQVFTNSAALMRHVEGVSQQAMKERACKTT